VALLEIGDPDALSAVQQCLRLSSAMLGGQGAASAELLEILLEIVDDPDEAGARFRWFVYVAGMIGLAYASQFEDPPAALRELERKLEAAIAPERGS
jgi:hypothetical protein